MPGILLTLLGRACLRLTAECVTEVKLPGVTNGEQWLNGK